MTKLSPPAGSRTASPRPPEPSEERPASLLVVPAVSSAAAVSTPLNSDGGPLRPALAPAMGAPTAVLEASVIPATPGTPAAPGTPATIGPAPAMLPAQPTPWQRAERLIDEVLFEKTLAQVMGRPMLQVMRLQLIADIAEIPYAKAKALSTYARLWAGQDSAPVAQALSLRALIEHIEASALPAAAATQEALGAVRALLVQRDELRRGLSEGATLLHQIYFVGQSPPDALGRVALAKQLLVHGISPPGHLTEQWLNDSSGDLMPLFSSAISRNFFGHVQAFLAEALPEQATLWAAVNWTLAIFYLEAKVRAPKDVLVTRREDLRAWHSELGAHADTDEAALCAHLLAPTQAPSRTAAWRLACALHALLPRSRISDLVREIAWLTPQELTAYDTAARSVVPSWAPADDAMPLLNFLMGNLPQITPSLLGAYQRLVRPEHRVAQRGALLQALTVWYADGLPQGRAKAGAEAEAFVRAHHVPSALTAQVFDALALSSEEHPNLRPALGVLLRCGLPQPRAQAAILALLATHDDQRPMRAASYAEAVSPVRVGDLESSMHKGRIRASDLIVAQVMDRVPGARGWRQTLQQIAAYVQAAQIDPKTDRLLLDSTRTGVSELDNALNTLQGPRRMQDLSGALIDNPAYALGATGRVVGLGHLAAALWQLLRDNPMPAESPAQLLAERRLVRVNFILALARGIEDTGYRVCGYGLSERLTEACAGYIEGIEQATLVYPEPLLRAFATELSRSEMRHSRIGQETFFHDALAQAEPMLLSPEASEAFAEQWLAHMRDAYDWPEP